jgi:hypothetical protein
MKHVKVSLDDFEAMLATQIGEGDLCLGIRRALVLAGVRADIDPLRTLSGVAQGTDRLVLVTSQMAAFAAELKQLKADSARRREIAAQLVALGKLCLSLRAENNSSDRDL